ncbi:MAG TPA: DnaJ C-terminal domain-containing protein, partial [Burkholderiaceae bacterium]|nr:DnaJ C-terminal domain-containing protein [Burkholderiaceae bacterium]
FEDLGARFEDVSLEDLLASLARGRGARGAAGARAGAAMRGEDFEVTVPLTLEQASAGTELDLELAMPELGADGMLRRVPRRVKARIPKGATDGQRLRVPGKGGPGYGGGPAGDLYLNIVLHPHRLYRVVGHDLYLDLPLAPWEAVLGAAVQVPTLGGPVELRVPQGTRSGQRLRLSGRGLPKPGGGAGDLYAVVQIAVPPEPSDKERKLFEELARNSSFNPRSQLG